MKGKERMLILLLHLNPNDISLKIELSHILRDAKDWVWFDEIWNIYLLKRNALWIQNECLQANKNNLNGELLLDSTMFLDDLYENTKPFMHSFDVEGWLNFTSWLFYSSL